MKRGCCVAGARSPSPSHRFFPDQPLHPPARRSSGRRRRAPPAGSPGSHGAGRHQGGAGLQAAAGPQGAWAARAASAQSAASLQPLTAPSRPLLQRFLFRTQDVADVDRSRVQREILDLVQQHGERRTVTPLLHCDRLAADCKLDVMLRCLGCLGENEPPLGVLAALLWEAMPSACAGPLPATAGGSAPPPRAQAGVAPTGALAATCRDGADIRGGVHGAGGGARCQPASADAGAQCSPAGGA